ncbi:hypothetical protein glysoja_022809 [Glycine soja]|nr:hypothetical protein glysoja_022809 [Glycine soja]
MIPPRPPRPLLGRRLTRHRLCRRGGPDGPPSGDQQRCRGPEVPDRRPPHHPPRQLHPPGPALRVPLRRRQKLPQPLQLPTQHRPHIMGTLVLGPIVRAAHRAAPMHFQDPGILPQNIDRQRRQGVGV